MNRRGECEGRFGLFTSSNTVTVAKPNNCNRKNHWFALTAVSDLNRKLYIYLFIFEEIWPLDGNIKIAQHRFFSCLTSYFSTWYISFNSFQSPFAI